MQPAPLHNIMELPGVVLESVLLFLPPPELARCEALTCHSLRSTLPGTFWERAITTGLSSFMPAHLYFDNGVNTSSEALSGLTGRDRYPGHAEQCDDEMAMLVCEAGLHGRRVQWEANVESVARKTRHVDLLVRVRVVMGRGGGAVAGEEAVMTMERYARWARAFRCQRHPVGQPWSAARRQCAGCGLLLCLGCAVRCSEDKPEEEEQAPGGSCPFALCLDCHGMFSNTGSLANPALVAADRSPGLWLTPCSGCWSLGRWPAQLYCPWHIDCHVAECNGASCGVRLCADHEDTYVPPGASSYAGVMTCVECGACYCGRLRCQPLHRRLRACLHGCGAVLCTLCCRQPACPRCEQQMRPLI